MTLSIDDLPAPFGPMMARISPSRMSKLTSLSALHAAEAQRDVVDRQQHLAAVAAVVRRPGPGRLPQAAGSVADHEIGLDPALAAVLEGDLGLDAGPRGRPA